MTSITFVDGSVFHCIGIHGRQITYGGILRDSLIFIFDKEDVLLEDLVDIFTESNCKQLHLTVEDNPESQEVFLHEDYTIRVGLGETSIENLLNQGSNVSPTQIVRYVQMAQTTYTERQIQQQQEVLDALLLSTLSGGQ